LGAELLYVNLVFPRKTICPPAPLLNIELCPVLMDGHSFPAVVLAKPVLENIEGLALGALLGNALTASRDQLHQLPLN
jgi:hypothetical protein